MSAGVVRRRYTPDEVEAMPTPELLSLYKQTGDEELKWPLVLRYEGLIKSAALQIRGVYSSFAQVDDIVSEGILTLLSSIDKFDPDKGIKFETYVAKRIRGMVIDLARKQDWLPRNIRQRAKEIDAAVSNLANELGRFPTDHEVADHLGMPTDKYQKEAARVALSNTLSLDALMDARDLEGHRFEVSSEDPTVQPETVLEDQELQQTLAQGVAALQENEQIVLSLYYEKNLHMKEIAQVMGVSEPRISQIHSRAIQKLRDHMGAYMNSEAPQKTSKKRKKV
ncbi:MAG: FliA/WhiG family RNA polymerase sigma factor [Oscillospiraceae bacterium]|nr:FliA/WhiG family RNA polymerase sigma factor [Oscillospiraceae bacterium]MDE7171291.1 FliA/WhiG family RNA polymerase sigma factor [Oscillospiraceae bacterium]